MIDEVEVDDWIDRKYGIEREWRTISIPNLIWLAWEDVVKLEPFCIVVALIVTFDAIYE